MGEMRTLAMIDAPLSGPLALGAPGSPGGVRTRALAFGTASKCHGALLAGTRLAAAQRDATRGQSQVAGGFAAPRYRARLASIVNLAAHDGWTVRPDGPLGAGAG